MVNGRQGDVASVRVGGTGRDGRERERERARERMSRNRDRVAKVKTVIAGSEEERDQKDRIDKLQKEKHDLLDGEWAPARACRCAALPAQSPARPRAFALTCGRRTVRFT